MVHIFSFQKTGTRPWYGRTEISVFQQIEPCIDLHRASLVITFQLSFSSCLNLLDTAAILQLFCCVMWFQGTLDSIRKRS
jgi:hypothetical protein